ncbi:hypothetical protein SAMN04488134_11370 [Amphibacillus marinus]|uniref:Uncharacterized protein n=1 Tax=Amphibacillus marinus TaxID=872970 RepID=A0A1H8SQD9_9BACI|nr:hypothetical protein [Amphibacillus marinus]SEO80851.1 hypothetical protein SAMN04488134_11370 [Amphibacillus marinus]
MKQLKGNEIMPLAKKAKIHTGQIFDLKEIAEHTTPDIAETIEQKLTDWLFKKDMFIGYVIKTVEYKQFHCINISIIDLDCTFQYRFEADSRQPNRYLLKEKMFFTNYYLEQLTEHIKTFQAAYYADEKHG